MGVKDLWCVISPFCERTSLWDLEGKTIAIDLSAWICDSQFGGGQPNSYLRNLFFRTSFLLLLGAKPIFILEGSAPQLKTATIRRRMGKEARDSDDMNAKTVKRNRLTSLQNQCMILLDALGVPHVKAPGEAEQYCAHLNQRGVVDGIVTQDSDAFLYGAQVVYRNFQMTPSYTCDMYQMRHLENKAGLTRDKMIAFSLLTGNDYSSGVSKVGKETAIQFLKSFTGQNILERFTEWTSPSFVSSNWGRTTREFQMELEVRQKAIQCEGFPFSDIINEYLQTTIESAVEFEWSEPKMAKFIAFAVKKLNWEEDYSTKKFLPLLTRWHLLNRGAPCGTWMTSIIKTRQLRGVSCYEVMWESYEETTSEPKALVNQVYPDLVASFEEMIDAKKKKPKKAKAPRNEKKEPEKEDVSPVKSIEEDVELDVSFDLDTSSIINSIVSRPVSNPALLMYNGWKKN